MRTRHLRACLCALVLASAPATAQDLFIRTLDRVHTAEGEVLEKTSILVRGGKIAALGSDLEAPAGVTVIEGAGLEATPGIIDAHSHIAIEGGVNEGSDAITPEVRIADVINPESKSIQRSLAGGCTAAHLMHGSANVIGGQNAVIKLKWKRAAHELLVSDAPGSVKFALGENPKRSNSRSRGRRPRRYPSTRMGVEAVLREAFDGAQAYRAAWRDYEARKRRGENALPPRKDLRKAALVDILAGRLRIHCHCYRADEILMMLRLADTYGIKVAVLHHGLEAYRLAPEIAAHGAGVATFADWWAYKMEAYDATPYNARILMDQGVLTSIKSDSGDHIRRLNVEAAKAVKYGGVGPNDALKLVTLNPARQLGIDHRTGSLAKGKDADIALWNGDPLSTYSRVEFTIVDGEIQFDRKKDLDGRKSIRRTLHPEESR